MRARIDRRSLISDHALAQNQAMHEAPEGFGGSGWKHAEAVVAFAEELGAARLLDYGCGERTLRKQLKLMEAGLKLAEYDPAVPKLAADPGPADLVVCTDVLEHVEPALLDNVLTHLRALSLDGCYLSIATRPANKLLPDGRNAHLIVEDTPWWRARLTDPPLDWTIVREEDRRKEGGTKGHSYNVWLRSGR